MSSPGNPRLHAAVKRALAGGSTVDLSDLSPNRTLVLVNGLRLAPKQPGAVGVAADSGDKAGSQAKDAD
jgi:hypothetical protein